MHSPKGILISIGGNVDKGTAAEPNYKNPSNLAFFEDGILKRILSEMKGVTVVNVEDVVIVCKR